MVAVLTLLSKSPSASRQTQSLLHKSVGLRPAFLNGDVDRSGKNADEDLNSTKKWSWSGDDLDNADFLEHLNTGNVWWDSKASICPVSGTILHFISMASDSSSWTSVSKLFTHVDSVTLIGISTTAPDKKLNLDFKESFDGVVSDAIVVTRSALSQRIRTLKQQGMAQSPFLRRTKLAIMNQFGMSISLAHILGGDRTAPVVNLRSFHTGDEIIGRNIIKNESSVSHNTMRLRECTIPYFDSEDHDRLDISQAATPSIREIFESSSGLVRPIHYFSRRPIPGLYQVLSDDNTGLVFRPIPAAKDDKSISFPSLIFQCANIEQKRASLLGASLSKIGYGGGNNQGQVLIRFPGLQGIDIRLCQSNELSSCFAEAQEALLAGSIDELQSAHVLSDGVRAQPNQSGVVDRMNGVGDCWIEFRALMKNPQGFFRNLKSIGKQHSSNSQISRFAV